eukprot:8616080-Pyramimonas_sp.AAC.1
MLKGMLVCLTCGPFDRFTSGRCHKSKTRHDMRPMNDEERAQDIELYRAIEADGEPARLAKLNQRRAESRKHRAEARQQESADPDAAQ